MEKFEEAAHWLFARLGYIGNPEAQRAEALKRWPWLTNDEEKLLTKYDRKYHELVREAVQVWRERHLDVEIDEHVDSIIKQVRKAELNGR
jgi:hypothetical protein